MKHNYPLVQEVCQRLSQRPSCGDSPARVAKSRNLKIMVHFIRQVVPGGNGSIKAAELGCLEGLLTRPPRNGSLAATRAFPNWHARWSRVFGCAGFAWLWPLLFKQVSGRPAPWMLCQPRSSGGRSGSHAESSLMRSERQDGRGFFAQEAP